MKAKLKAAVPLILKAVLAYLHSPQAKRWEVALLAGIGAAIEQAIKQAF